MSSIFRRTIELLTCCIITLLCRFSAPGHYEDMYMFLMYILSFGVIDTIFTIVQRDLLFRLIVYPISLGAAWALFGLSMAEKYGGFTDPTRFPWRTPGIYVFSGLALVGTIILDFAARTRGKDNNPREKQAEPRSTVGG